MPNMPVAARQHDLADDLRRQRRSLATALLTGIIPAHEVTLGNEMLAESFIDRFADAVDGGDWDAFLAWVDKMCEKHADSAAIARVLTRGVATIARALPHDQADFSAIAAAVTEVAARPRLVTAGPAHASLDVVDVALDGLVARLGNFDIATAEHSRAVAVWCMRIGKRMSLTPLETTFVMRAGLIHDIGKLTTPPEILNAPYVLNDTEMAIMRQHAAAGADIIANHALLAPLTPVVRGHHERVDGRGYPDGLTASEIPIMVRIVSVADSFNAMIGNRPYRLPLAPNVALEQLKKHSGSQFDPNVVAAMIDVVNPER